jgi:hypothetical protein
VDNVIREKQLLMNFDSNYIVRALGCFQVSTRPRAATVLVKGATDDSEPDLQAF